MPPIIIIDEEGTFNLFEINLIISLFAFPLSGGDCTDMCKESSSILNNCCLAFGFAVICSIYVSFFFPSLIHFVISKTSFYIIIVHVLR